MVDAISARTPASSPDVNEQTRSLDERLRRSLPAQTQDEKPAEAQSKSRKRRAEGLALPLAPAPLLHSATVLSHHGLVAKGKEKEGAKDRSRVLAGGTSTKGPGSKTAVSKPSAAKTEGVERDQAAAKPRGQSLAGHSDASAVKSAHSGLPATDRKPRRVALDQDAAGKLDAIAQHAGTASDLTSALPQKPAQSAFARPVWAQPSLEPLESAHQPGMTYQFKSWGAGHAVNVHRIVGEDGQIGFLLNPSSDQVAQQLRDHPQMPQDAQLRRDQRDQQQHGHGARDDAPQDEEA